MNAKNALRLGAGLLFATLALTSSGQTVRPVTGFTNQTFARNDDAVLPNVAIGFGINFFGNPYTQLSLSNNGNVQFNGNDGTFTPFNLTGATGTPVYAGVDFAATTCPDGTNSDNDGGTCVGHGVPESPY